MLDSKQAIQFTNFKKYFGSGKKLVKAVDDISFSVPEGEIFGFLGKNGAGKSTTIRCMMDFMRPTSGMISIFGKDAQVDAIELKQDIGYLSGNVHIQRHWNGQEHIDYVEKLNGKENISKELIERLSFDPKMKSKQLSSGNRQKLGIILALMHQPKLIILDEPTNALDPLLQQAVYDLLEEARSRGATIFMSSHNLAEVERICDRVAIIKDGVLVATESIASLSQKHVYTVKARFSDKVQASQFHIENASVDVIDEYYVQLSVKGSISTILDRLNTLPLDDLVVQHASLEEMFIEYYQG